MTGSNETVCTIENDAATQVEEVIEIPPNNGNYITAKNDEPKWIKSVAATSIVLKDFENDINGLQPNSLEKNVKKEKDNPLQEFEIQIRNTAWVQFFLFKKKKKSSGVSDSSGYSGSSGYRGSSGYSGSSGTRSTSSSSEFSSKSIDYRVNYEPGKRNNYILIVLSLAIMMWFLNAISLYAIFASDFLRAVFKEPGVFLTSLEFGMLIRCYFWFICLPMPRPVLLSLIPLFLTLITVIGLAAMISVRYDTDVFLNASLVTLIVTVFLLILSATCFNLRSILLYLHCIILAFLLAMMFIMISSYVTEEPYKTDHMVILVSAAVAQAAALVMELQGIVNGTSIAELDKRDYILGAFLLYTSLVTLAISFAKFVGLYKEVIK